MSDGSVQADVAALIVLARDLRCAVPLAHLVETMRPLPVESVAGMPRYVRGLSLIRGLPVPVVDLGALLGCDGPDRAKRFVTVAIAGRVVALAVEDVVGIRLVSNEALAALPPLLGDASKDVVEALGTLDAALLVVLRTARLMPDQAWKGLAAIGAPA